MGTVGLGRRRSRVWWRGCGSRRRRVGTGIGRIWTGCGRWRCIWWCCSTPGSGRFPGGYIGVDVFFVLSGFLVTQLLLRDLQPTGAIRFGRFYARRFRRLLPAAFVALDRHRGRVHRDRVTGRGPRRRRRVQSRVPVRRRTGTSSTRRPATSAPTSPPTRCCTSGRSRSRSSSTCCGRSLLGGLFVVTRRFGPRQRTRALRASRSPSARVASLAWALVTANAPTPTGPTTAPTPAPTSSSPAPCSPSTPAVIARLARRRHRPLGSRRRRPRRARGRRSPPGSASTPSQRGIVVTIITCVLIVALEAADGGLARPRAVQATPSSTSARSPTAPTCGTGSSSSSSPAPSTPATLVHHRRRHPRRHRPRLAQLPTPRTPHPHLAPSSTATAAPSSPPASPSASSPPLVIIPAITDPATHHRRHRHRPPPPPASPPSPPASTGERHQGRLPSSRNCYDKPVTDCTLVHGTGPHILLIGDSHAGMLIPAFVAIAQREHLTLSVSTDAAVPGNATSTPSAETRGVRDDDVERRVQADQGRHLRPGHPGTQARHHRNDEPGL